MLTKLITGELNEDKMPTLRNTFEGGMVHDHLDTLPPSNTYKYALNAIDQSREAHGFGGLVNEEYNELVASFGGTIVGRSHIDEWNATLFFVNNGSSELWLFYHGSNEKKFICSDQEFGCEWGFDGCELLYGEFKQFNACNELHVYWSSDCIYHVVNINEMLDRDRKAAVKACEDCTYFDVFKVTCGPNLSALPARNSGSALEAGSVQFAVQLRDYDGNTTNVFDVSQPVPIESEDNIAGQQGKGSARLRLDGLDKKYDEVIIYVIKTVNGVTTVEKMPARGYSDKGLTFEYYGQKGELVNVTAITNKSKAFLRGQDLIQKDGRMFFYNIKNERNLNYQKYANNITVEWVEFEVSLEQQEKYHFPSLMRGEVYALGIVWKYVDGTYSPVFHIPGCPGSGGGGSSNQTSQSSNVGGSPVENEVGNRIAAYDYDSQYCLDGGGNCVECSYCDECSPCTPSGEGSKGAVSGSSSTTDPSADDGYVPLKPGDFDTTDQMSRKRNPDEIKDRPNESDNLENSTKTDINNIDTSEDDVVNAGNCHDNLHGCNETKKALDRDLEDMMSTIQNASDILAGFGLDKPDPDTDTTNSLKEAALKLMDEAVIEREYFTFKRPTLNYSGTNQGGPGKSPEEPEPLADSEEDKFTQKGVGVSNISRLKATTNGSIRGDNWTDAKGNPLTDEPVRVVDSGETKPWRSVVEYPDDKDCDGEFFYPQGTVCHHQIPTTAEKPHFVSFQNGVENQYQPENDPYGKTYVRPIGLRFSNIKTPDQDDLPKPLCPQSPFKIVYVKRTDQNKRIFAKGWCSGMFVGQNHGSEYFFPRHGVNSFETVDRMIAAGTDGLSRKGDHYDGGAYTFHSPDTDCDESFLPVTHVRPELALLGSGWRYGLYAKGKEPEGDRWHGSRKDNRGARVANNINHYTAASGEDIPILGLTYAPSNSVVTPPSGVSKPLMNRFRESSVFFEIGSALPGSDRDESFVGDVLVHYAPTTANAPYVALVRDVPDQYGSVQSLEYIELGINATQAHAQGVNAIEGICGDVWIGPYSKRRTSYVSNKVGDFYNPPAKPGSPCRERSICDTGDDKIFQYLGIDHYPTKLPKSGDKWEPKNYAGLHTVEGDCGAFGRSKEPGEAADAGDSESDFYWPRTLKSLVHCIVESHVNPYLRETGQGSQIKEGKVWYPKLKDLYLDAASPTQHPWEESFLTRFYAKLEQPSKAQIFRKALIRMLLGVGLPMWLLSQFQELESVVDTVSAPFTFTAMASIWMLLTNTLLTNRRLDSLLGIAPGLDDYCKRDEEGGDLDEIIENFEDAYCAYNWDYSKVNDLVPFRAFTLPYNTCDCDDCSKEQTNNEIYHSNKQNLDSEIDAYRNVKINNYNELPANAGKLQKLFIQGSGFYAHTTDGIWMLKLAPVSVPSDIVSQQSGTGELLSEPQLLFEGIAEGFAGTQHPNAAINTAFGYFFIDDNAKKIYRFNGRPEEISAYGMFHFFKDNLGFCNPKACYDEKTDFGIHYALGFDYRYNRLLVTKQDGTSCSSFTVSYNVLGIPTQGGGARGKWVSFHSYIPQDYLWDRNNFYSILSGKGEVWQHNMKGKYQTFYGELKPFMVQFGVSSQNKESWDFENLILDTDAEIMSEEYNYPIKDLDLTFNKLSVFNSTQGTGTLPIEFISDNTGARDSQYSRITQDYSKVRYMKVLRNWNANALKDLIADGCSDQPLLKRDCNCQPIPDINEDIFSCKAINSQNSEQRIINDKFLNFRYTLDNADDVRLYLKSQLTNDDQKLIAKQD